MSNRNIVIVGAGLIGTSAALSLKNTGLSITILENHLSDIINPNHQNTRPISLSYGSVRILIKLGLWEALEKFACPILSVHVSEKGKLGFTEFSAREQNVPALGYVVPFSRLQAALYHHTAEQKMISFMSINAIDKIKNSDNGATIVVQSNVNESILQADLLIIADGTQSHCRDLLGISCSEKEEGDVAHIYQLQLSDQHHHVAYERFTQFGVLAILPLYEGNKAQLVWTITPAQAKKINAWDDTNTLTFLQDAFEGRLEIASIKKVAQFPLKTIIAEKQTMQSAILLGNAAHTIYPVAAQGFNLGLRDVSILSQLIIDDMNHRKKWAVSSLLKNYEARAAEHQQAIFRITNSLTCLFDLPCIGKLRGLGLLSTNIITPIKNKLAKRMMGMR